MKSLNLSLAALVCVASTAVRSAPIVLGTGEAKTLTVVTDTVQSDAVTVGDRTTIEKSGAGTLTIPASTLTEGKDLDVKVREGGFLFRQDAPLPPNADDDVADLFATAAFHVDAARAATIVKDGTGRVTDWLDVRETGDGSEGNPFQYIRAHTDFTLNADGPTYVCNAGTNSVLFGGSAESGVTMNWLNPNGSPASVTGIRNAFIVWGGDTCGATQWGCVLGTHNGTAPYFQPAGNASGSAIFINHNYENVPMHASRVYENGNEIDAFTTTNGQGFKLLEVECLIEGQTAQCFMNDREMFQKNPVAPYRALGGQRVGGGHVCEVVLFTSQLSTTDRLRVEHALMKKWFPQKWAARTVKVNAATAEGTDVVLNAGFSCVVPSGDGRLVKQGEGSGYIAPAYPERPLRGGAKIEAGTLDTGTVLAFDATAGDAISSTKQRFGYRYVQTAGGAAADALAKTGDGPVILNAVPADVTNLAVNAGTLILESRGRKRNQTSRADEVADICATVPNADFEDDASEQVHSFTNGASFAGWHAVVPALWDGSTTESSVFLYNPSLGSRGDVWALTDSGANGPTSLAIKNNASAWTEIVVPTAGVYEVSMWVAGRNGQTGLELKLMLGSDAEHLEQFGVLNRWDGSNTAWHKYTWLTPNLEPGTYQFWFKNPEENTDKCYQIDDIRFRLARRFADGAWKIPNGDFESVTGYFDAKTYAPGNTNNICNWTFTQGTSGGGEYPHTVPVTATMGNGRYYNAPWARPGDVQVLIACEGGAISSTFRPPAGTWRFRAWTGCKRMQASAMNQYHLHATMQMGDATVDLGSVTLTKASLELFTWPNAFTTDGETDVTLTVTGAMASGQVYGRATIDDLELVEVRPDSTSLIANGGFESMTGWHTFSTPKPTSQYGLVSGISQIERDFFKQYFGSVLLDGTHCLKIVNDDSAWQSVTFPTGGLHRLSFYTQARSPKGGFTSCYNPLRVYLAQGASTNELFLTDTCATTNFTEWVTSFMVPPEGGTYDLGFQGQVVWDGGSEVVDKTTCLEGVSLYQVLEDPDDAFTLPEHLRISVASGAKLQLDFEGAFRVDSLRINGRTYAGTITADRCPEALSGPGTLEVMPRGTFFILR